MIKEIHKPKILFLTLAGWKFDGHNWHKILKCGTPIRFPLLWAYDTELRERERAK